MASHGKPIVSQPPPPRAVQIPISKALHYSDSYQQVSIAVLMVAAIVMSCLMLLGSLRKRTTNALFKNSLWATVALAPLAVSYGLGQMTSLRNELVLVWGFLLLIGLASYGSISAYQLEENETALRAVFQGLFKCGFVYGLLLGNSLTKIPAYIRWLLTVLVPFALLRLYDRAMSMAYASKNNMSQGIGDTIGIVADFMLWDVAKTFEAEEATADPTTMYNYRYLVGMKSLLRINCVVLPPCYYRDFEKDKEIIVTTQEIWQCEGELLSASGGDPEGRLKDTCLSFALFWMLLRRYTGHPLAEVTSLEGKTWNFVRYGLMPDISSATSERTFRVIEQELSFVYDYFYTRSFRTYMNGFRTMIIQLILVVAYILIAHFILRNYKNTLSFVVSDHLLPIKLDVLITEIAIYTMCMFEFVIMINYLFVTQWSRVEWVCTYVRKKLWRNLTWKDKCLRWTIEHICRHSLHRKFKHWKREIDQYSLLHSHGYRALTYYFSSFLPVDLPKKGRKVSKSIPFCINIKMAILSSLHTNGRQLSNGKSALRKYGVETDFSWACDLETQTQTILVWHIATSFCELNFYNRHHGNLKSDSLLVPTSLSQYCAYLVAFAPELLPDQTDTAYNIINYVIWEANNMFKGCHKMEKKYEKMMAMTEQCNGAKDPILKKGIWLGKSLADRMSNETLWDMLGEFWAELLLYLAPSDDATAHIKHLADGCELITHLWTLLTHAGIIKRD